jgi:hypothetical protein
MCDKTMAVVVRFGLTNTAPEGWLGGDAAGCRPENMPSVTLSQPAITTEPRMAHDMSESAKTNLRLLGSSAWGAGDISRLFPEGRVTYPTLSSNPTRQK